jgi:hypothetical protein
VPEINERVFELGRGALAEQERQVSEVRSRGPALLAAGTVVASLLAKPVFHDGHPHGVLEVIATTVGLVGAASVLVFVVLLMRPYELGFSVNAAETYRQLFNLGIVDQPLVDLTLAETFDDRRAANADVVRSLATFLTLALAALVIETIGLAAAAALAS